MESLMSGTLAGTGSFRCEDCGYVVTLAAADELPACPGCGGARFVRASLFAPARFQRTAGDAPTAEEREALVAEARGAASRARASTSPTRTAATIRVVALDARVDADRPQPGRRRPLRRPDGLAPSRADRAPGRRRARARRPQPQRRVRQRRARRVARAARRRRDRRRPPPPALPGHDVEPPAHASRHRAPRRQPETGTELEPADRRRPPIVSAIVARMAETIAVLSQKGGTGKTTAVRHPDRRLPPRGPRRAGRRPRPAGQPVGLLRRRPGRRRRRSPTCSPAAPRPREAIHDGIIPANLEPGRGGAARWRARWAAS